MEKVLWLIGRVKNGLQFLGTIDILAKYFFAAKLSYTLEDV